MKLRLPIQLFRALLVLAGIATAQAAVMHSAVSYNTYVDFASNAGRFAVGTTNELLEYMRERDNGVRIEYTNGETSAPLPHGMISFDSVADMGNGTLINYNYLVTVKHNATLDPTFGANKYGVGPGNELKYKGIEEAGPNGSFVMDSADPDADYKLIRLSKLVTDATSANLYYPAVVNGKTQVESQLVYRVGGGNHQVKGVDGKVVAEYAGGGYNVGGIGSLVSWEDIKINNPSYPGVYSEVKGKESWALDGFSEETPLPFGSQGGDSGSPYFVWNENAETPGFELLMVHRGSLNNGEVMYADADPNWTREAIEQQSVRVDMGIVTGTLKINGTDTKPAEDGWQYDTFQGREVITKPYRGFLQDDDGNLVYDKVKWESVAFNGVKSGQHTWKSLSALKDNPDWYAYGNEYLNAGDSLVLNGKEWETNPGISLAELYQTQNLVFEAAADKVSYDINVTADTDLGVGYIQFSAGKYCEVGYNVKSESNHLLNSAGYVVDAGVQVNVSLRNEDKKYMREWRKVGEGTLNICGTGGDNEIFLNVGGTGETLLNQQKGYYAAYNVLVNTGAVLRIADVNQIKRDLTFGNGGGTLDMNGNSMDWYMTRDEERGDGFTINALTEEAVIFNSAARHAELTYKEEGNTKFAGSFQDSEASSLGIIYAGGGTWELNSIRTSLQHADSGLTVQNGTVKLSGTLTAHGHGSLLDSNGRPVYDSAGRALFATRDNDWHYADATMNVTVKDKATLELESHARLIGTVTLESGGRFIMHEGVQHAEEYIEGGEKLEKTADIADFYGHKGDVKLAHEATLSWQWGSKELASLEGESDSGALLGVEATLASDTSLHLAAAREEEMGRIAAAALTLQADTKLELENLYIESGSSITSTNGIVSADGVTLEITSSNAKVSETHVPLELVSCLDGKELTLSDATTVLDIQSDILSGNLAVTAKSLTLDLSSLDLLVASAVKVYFGEGVIMTNQNEMEILAQTQSGTLVGYYSASDPGAMYFVASVPEPATATLGLLALTMLSCRRQRR